jgi:cytochrome-b5 reductase
LSVCQHARRYASESTQTGGSSNAILYSTVGVGAVGIGAWWFNRGKAPAAKTAEQKAPAAAPAEAPKVFKGGDQGFVPLTLEEVYDINHNTKKFRFKFEDKDAVSGLSIASALITKFQGPEDEKPTIKPYTPTSDEGEL